MRNLSDYIEENIKLRQLLNEAKYSLQYLAYNYDPDRAKRKIPIGMIESTDPVDSALITIRNIDNAL